MTRHDMIERIGNKYVTSNIEGGEFSYVQALKAVGKDIKGTIRLQMEHGTNFLTSVLKMSDW